MNGFTPGLLSKYFLQLAQLWGNDVTCQFLRTVLLKLGFRNRMPHEAEW